MGLFCPPYSFFNLNLCEYKMCLIILTRDSSNIPKEFFAQVYRYNRDGWGIAYRKADSEGVVQSVAKRGFGLNELYDAYKEIDNAGGKNFAIHMRLSTHGATSLEMCHPFEVSKGMFLMHNGMTSYPGDFVSRADERSDTYLLASRLVSPLLRNRTPEEACDFIRSSKFANILAKEGSGKFAIADKRGCLYFNPNQWSETSFGALTSNAAYYDREYHATPTN